MTPISYFSAKAPPWRRRKETLVQSVSGIQALDAVVRFSESWGGLKKHIPLIEQALKTGNPIAPLLARPPTPEEKGSELACGGCSI
jgi:hypothetical protein